MAPELHLTSRRSKEERKDRETIARNIESGITARTRVRLIERLGSTVAAEGHLEEPFFLLPLEWALILLSEQDWP